MIPYSDPTGFLDCSPSELSKIVNGCGPGGDDWKSRLLSDLIPDHLMGVDFTGACNRHDFDYWLGKDRLEADNRLFLNMCIDCANQKPEMLPIFVPFALTYRQAVRREGASCFGSKQ